MKGSLASSIPTVTIFGIAHVIQVKCRPPHATVGRRAEEKGVGLVEKAVGAKVVENAREHGVGIVIVAAMRDGSHKKMVNVTPGVGFSNMVLAVEFVGQVVGARARRVLPAQYARCRRQAAGVRVAR